MLFYYAKPNQMKGHNYTDDVAITFAKNKEDAYKKFLSLYGNCEIKDVQRIYINSKKDYIRSVKNDVVILTDY